MPEQTGFGYRLLRRFAHFWVRRFFRRVQINGAGNIIDGPVLFAMNHPNNLIDSLMVSFAIKRKVHYLATSQIFRNKLLALFLHNAGVIPVYRKQDDPSHSRKNIATFQACYQVLKDGGAIAIYPEGITHAEPRVKKIKTGAARIALETEHQYRIGVKIIPVGLNFSLRKSFRSEVLISIGASIDVQAYLPNYEKDSSTAVEQLTKDLQEALEKEVIHVDEPELDQLVREIEEIYKGELILDLVHEQGLPPQQIDSFRLSKKLIEGIHFFNTRDPARVMRVHEEVRNYKNRLQKARLDDSLLQRILTHPASYRRFLARVILLLAGFPLALWGGVNHFLPYQISRWTSRHVAKRETDYATVRILSGILLYSAFYSAQIYWTLTRFGWFVGLLYGSTLPFFGAFVYFYWEKFKQFRSDLRLFFVILTRKQLLAQLIRRRERLIAELDRAKEDYLHAIVQA